MWQAFIESPGRVSLCGPRRPGSPEPAPYHAGRPRDRAPEPARRSEAERASCSAGPYSEHLACLISRRRTYPASTSQNAPKSGRAGAPAGVRSRGSVRCMGARAMGGERVGEPSQQPAPGGSLMHAWCAHSRPRRARTQAQVAPRPHPPSRTRRDAPPAWRHRPPGREPHPPRTPCMAAVQDESSRRIVTAHARHACRPHVQQQTYTHPRAPGCHRGMPRGAL